MYYAKRNREIFELHKAGWSYSKIAAKFNLSSSRVQQLYKREEILVKNERDHADALNGKTKYDFLDALIETNAKPSTITRIFTILNRKGILQNLVNDVHAIDDISDEEFLDMWTIGTTSLRFIREANDIYKKRITGD